MKDVVLRILASGLDWDVEADVLVPVDNLIFFLVIESIETVVLKESMKSLKLTEFVEIKESFLIGSIGKFHKIKLARVWGNL